MAKMVLWVHYFTQYFADNRCLQCFIAASIFALLSGMHFRSYRGVFIAGLGVGLTLYSLFFLLGNKPKVFHV
jgi:H+/gluconate symporter-like permease